MKRLVLALALALLVTPAVYAAAATAGITVSDAWSRPAAQGGNGAGYATLANRAAKADTLVAASSPVAQRIEIHESMIMGGQAMMHPRPGGLAIPANGAASLKPGGWHLMLMGLKQPLKAGETFPVTLTFKKAGKVEVVFTVRTTAP
ncbi:MAG: copper chaperone PCu(A)C [Caulobacter sp.]|nr:copper chaperone PCu(A)C [Caulobacter sp.]